MSELVTYQVEDKVAVLTLSAPPANTYSYDMMLALDAAVLKARMDDDVHVLLLTGLGDKFFCAGADINMLNDVTPTFKYNFCLHANETLTRLENTSKLVIAALNGHTVGGGLEVAMAADLRIAKEGGGKIGLPEVALGVLPGTGGTQRLARILGKSRAMEWMVTGKTVDFSEAQAIGLVHQLLPPKEFMKSAMDYARSFTPPNRASRAVGLIKRSVVSGSEMSMADGLALERELQQQLFMSTDAKEGIAAYVEKRKASFSGK